MTASMAPAAATFSEAESVLAHRLMKDHGCLHHQGRNPLMHPCRACARRVLIVREWLSDRLVVQSTDQSRQPSSEVGTYLVTHDHQWEEIAAHRMPVGSWHPVFGCWCGSVIVDLHVIDHIDAGSTCVDCEQPLTSEHRCSR